MTTIRNIKKQYLVKDGYRDLEHWLENENHIYIGRNMTVYVPGAIGSKWKNPYTLNKYNIDESLKLYKEYILNNKKLMSEIYELKGRVLGCWCITETNKKCHGQVLIDILNELEK